MSDRDSAFGRGCGPSGPGSIAGSYIVVFKADTVRSAGEAGSEPHVAVTARGLVQAHGGDVTRVYQHALKGFAVRMTAGQADALSRNPRVAYVEPDQVVHAVATQSPAMWGSIGSTSATHP